MTIDTTATTRLEPPGSRPLAYLREQMAASAAMAYFDHAALSPIPQVTAERMQAFVAQTAAVGNIGWLEWMKELQQTRATAAAMLGATADEIALVGNTTDGVNLVAEGLDWREGDNVVTLADEFPANVYPWTNLKSRGVETRFVPTDNGAIDPEQLAEACDNRTRVLSVSWVGYKTGYRVDLDQIASIAHKAGALFFVDAIQGLGVFPIDVSQTPIDALSFGGQKWLLGVEGAAIAYIRSSCLDQLRPVGVGWNSVPKPYEYGNFDQPLKDTAARYEGGSWNMCGNLALGQSMKLLHSIGTKALSEQILEYTDLACERLTAAGAVIATNRDKQHRGGEQRSGIVYFDLPGRDPVEVRRQCIERNIVLSCRAGMLRIAPHAYNTEEDLNRLLEVVKS